MIVHSKMTAGDFLFGLKNDHTSNILHQRTPSPQAPTHTRLFSPHPYSCHQPQLLQNAQHLINGHHHQLFQNYNQHHSPITPPEQKRPEEVLDLSRRCDSVESHRKTPSPYNTTSSFGSNSPNTNNNDSPISSPNNNNIYSRPKRTTQLPNAGGLPLDFASAQHSITYPKTIKNENPTTSPTPLPLYHQPPHGNHFSSLLHSRLALAGDITTSMAQTDAERIQPTTTMATPISSISSLSPISASGNFETKSMRPFKAYPRDPLVIAANFAANDILLENRRLQRYTEFRKQALEDIRNTNGGHRTVTNPKMRRISTRSRSPNNSENDDRTESSDCDGSVRRMENHRTKSANDGNNNIGSGKEDSNTPINHQARDAAYYERRRKNNAAAKKSRDRRRIKEDEIAIRAAYLERQNIELLCQIDALKAQLAAFIKT